MIHFYILTKCIYCYILDLYMVLCFYNIKKSETGACRRILLLAGTVTAIRYLVINLGVGRVLCGLAGIVAVFLCGWRD